jgi:hypothetical protein
MVGVGGVLPRAPAARTLRGGPGIVRFFDGPRLLEPGVLSCTRWRPDAAATAEAEADEFCAVAREP